MRPRPLATALVLPLALVLALATVAGCGGTRHESDSSGDDWSPSSTSGATTDGQDAGVDAGADAGADAGGDPVRDRAMTLITRSCAPCHRHAGSTDLAAVQTGVYLETEAEIRQLAGGYAVGHTPMSLSAIFAQRAEGYDLMVGEANNVPMPPRGASAPGLTSDEARDVVTWLRRAP